MNKFVNAFGSDGSFIFSSSKGFERAIYQYSILESIFKNEDVTEVHCAAFGPRHDSYFLSYSHEKDGQSYFDSVWGLGLPPLLIKHLNRLSARNTPARILPSDLKIVLGEGNSFIVWDQDTILWHNIPQSLQEYFNSCTKSSTWWVDGPARLITIGTDEAYFVMMENGKSAWNFPISLLKTKRAWGFFWSKATFKLEDFAEVAFDPYDKDKFVMIEKVSDAMMDRCWFSVANGANALTKLLEKEERPQLEPVHGQRARVTHSHVPKKDKTELKLEQGQIITILQRNNNQWWTARDMKGQIGWVQPRKVKLFEVEPTQIYNYWKAQCQAMFAEQKVVTFPNIPQAVILCKDVACALRKQNPTGLGACEHDIEQLLRGSGEFSAAWLKKESYMWHPDVFTRRCDPQARELLVGKAAELFVIYNNLLMRMSGAE